MTPPLDTGTAPSTPPAQAVGEPRRLPRVNLRDESFRLDPHGALKAMRERERVLRDRVGSWLLTRHEDVSAALRTRQLSREPWRSNIYSILQPYLADSTLEKNLMQWVMFLDPPRHTRLRTAMAASFRPPVIEALRERVTAMADGLLDRWTGEVFELMEGLATLLPLMVICDLLGVPTGDLAQARAWSDALATIFEPEKGRDARVVANHATEEMLDYMRDHVARHRRAGRRDTLLGMLIAAQDEAGTLSESELLANLVLFFLASTETTSNLIGNGVLSLLRHPDQFALLRSQPSLLPQAVEEVLRYESPMVLTDRYTIEPYQVGDVTIPRGQLIYLMVLAANRDPAVFPDPDRFDITRRANPHLTFGAGIHYCLGATLARLQAGVALQCLWQRFPDMRLADEAPQWRPLMNLRGLRRLWLARGPSAPGVAAVP